MILTHQAERLRLVLAGITLALAAMLQANGADYPTTVLSFNPLAYWRLDETAAAPPLNIISNSGSLGRAGDGYAVLDVTNGEPGIVGNAIRLDNSGSTITYCGSKVDVPYNPAISRNFPFSIEFWAKPNSLPISDTTGVCPLSSLNNNWFGGANRSGWLFYCNNAGRWNFRLGLTSGYAANVNGTGANATVGTWQHLVVTYDGLTVKLYINGAVVGTQSSDAAATGWLPNTQSALRIGGTQLTGDLSDAPSPNVNGAIFGNSGNRGWDGWIDEVAIYPSVLDAATVAAHHDAATTNNAGYASQILAGSPVGYWQMEQSPVTPPDPGTFPVINNLGSLGASANGTNQWGALTGQTGSGYGGLGAANQAVFFDGENGSIALNDAPGLHFTGNITLMAWIKPAVQDFYRDILVHGYDGNYSETFLRITRGVGGTGAGDGNYYEIGATDDTSFYDSVLVPIPPGDIGNWVFLAGTYDGANWNLYRNGVLVGSVPGTSGTTGALDVTNAWSIGSRSDPLDPAAEQVFAATGLRFGGLIDEPAIFNKALTASNINAIYNSAQVPPVITRGPQPPDGTVYTGGSVSFSVWAEGSPTLNYSWYHDGALLSGETATNITLTGLSLASSGTYSVVVTNAYGAATSSIPLTVVTGPPIITQQPASQTRFAGGTFQFSVDATGSAPLSYQWNVGGTPIAGANQPLYSAVAQNSGSYTCTVTNLYGATNSDAATLTVVPPPGGYASAVVADNPVSYWRLGETNGTVAHDFIGGNDGVYNDVTLGLPGYSVIDSDPAAGFGAVNVYVGDISGTGVNFSGHTNFSIEAWVKGPAGQVDESTIIAKGAGSSGTLAAEQFSMDVVSGNYRIFTRGGNNSVYEADAAVGPDGNWQHVVGVYDDANSTISIYVNGQPSGSPGTTRPIGLRASSDPVSIGSKHLGNDPNYDGFFTGTIDEVAVYNYALTADQIQAHYAAAYGSSLPPTIVLPPEPSTNFVSLPTTLSVGAIGTVPLSYQWNKGGVPIPDATNTTYRIPALSSGDSGTYSVTITNVNGVTNSADVIVTVLPPPTTAPAISGLVLHLPFDNNLTDATGRGNNGTAIHISGSSSNAANASFLAGMIGQALHFSTDTNGPNNDYVTLGVRPDLQFSNNVSFTVAFWIRAPANYAGGDLPFISTAIGSTFNPGLVLAYTYGYGAPPWPGGWAFSILDSGGVGLVGRGDIGSINDGNWHHLAHVFDRKSGVSTFLDGVAVPFQKQLGTSFQAAGDVDTGNPFTIGQDPTGTYAETGSGDMDDLGVWRRALTPLEAASIYMAGVSNHLSFVNGTVVTTPIISIGKSGANWQITYTGVLRSSSTANGTYNPVNGATSPYTIPAGTQTQFYRSSSN
jgi:hypothetical protein